MMSAEKRNFERVEFVKDPENSEFLKNNYNQVEFVAGGVILSSDKNKTFGLGSVYVPNQNIACLLLASTD